MNVFMWVKNSHKKWRLFQLELQSGLAPKTKFAVVWSCIKSCKFYWKLTASCALLCRFLGAKISYSKGTSDSSSARLSKLKLLKLPYAVLMIWHFRPKYLSLVATLLEASRALEEGGVEFDNPITYFRF